MAAINYDGRSAGAWNGVISLNVRLLAVGLYKPASPSLAGQSKPRSSGSLNGNARLNRVTLATVSTELPQLQYYWTGAQAKGGALVCKNAFMSRVLPQLPRHGLGPIASGQHPSVVTK